MQKLQSLVMPVTTTYLVLWLCDVTGQVASVYDFPTVVETGCVSVDK